MIAASDGLLMPLTSSAMVGALHVNRDELYREMRARGFDLTDFFLEKFAICEGGYRDAYAKHREDATPLTYYDRQYIDISRAPHRPPE